jgi:phosphate transport system substrate-binding protein
MSKSCFLLLTLAFCLSFSFVSCKKKVKGGKWADTINAGFVQVACDESLKNLLNAELDVFNVNHPYAMVSPIYKTEGEAIRLLTIDSVRLALVTRDLNAKELKDLQSKNLRVRKYIAAFDGIAVINNKSNPDSIIGVPTIRKILTGEITEWSQIDPKSSLGTILIIFDNKESGVVRYAHDSIANGEALSSSNLYAMNNEEEVIEKVSQNPNALAFIGFSLIGNEYNSNSRELRNKVQLMRVGKEEKATLENSYFPYAGDIGKEKYPFWRPVYVLLSDPRMALSSGFSIFLSQQIGQKIIQKCGLLPITDAQNMSVNIVDEEPEKEKNNSTK